MELCKYLEQSNDYQIAEARMVNLLCDLENIAGVTWRT